MRIYHVEFIGHYPIGANAVIVAPSRNRAFRILLDRLAQEHLTIKNNELTPDDLVQITTEHEGIKFFHNGDY